MINRVILVGNLTKDAEHITTTGRPMSRMRLATNNRWRNADGIPQESVEFHTVVAFGGLAETAAQYYTRGRRVFVEGRLRTRQYEAADGNRRTTTEVIAETLRLLQARPGSEEAQREDGANGSGVVADLDSGRPLAPALTVTG